ncbi:MAG: hypothetical protein IPM29_06975 [Planctomycetes bacterium]|nr:hypothetical protein [Planctomycetota bacterium]
MLSKALRVLLLSSTCVALHAQQTIVVSGGGPALQQAIAVANPGDMLDVMAGSYDPIMVTKGLAIRCRAGVAIAQTGQAPAIAIERIPAGQTLLFAGGSCSSSTPLVPALRVANTDGTVVLRSIVASVPGTLAWALLIEGCRGAVLCRSLALSGTIGGFAAVNGSDHVTFAGGAARMGISVRAATVAFTGTQIDHGLTVESGSVSVTGGYVHGYSSFSGIGDPAIRLRSGELTLADDVDVRAVSAWPVPAILTNAGLVRVGPRVTLTSASTALPIEGPAQVQRIDTPSVRAGDVPAGAPLRIDVTGQPRDLVATFVDVPRTPRATPFGPLWVDPSSPLLDLRTLDATGTFSITVPAPVAPGTAWTLQPLALTQALALAVGTPARVFVE